MAKKSQVKSCGRGVMKMVNVSAATIISPTSGFVPAPKRRASACEMAIDARETAMKSAMLPM